jgi:hypothetical protein
VDGWREESGNRGGESWRNRGEESWTPIFPGEESGNRGHPFSLESWMNVEGIVDTHFPWNRGENRGDEESWTPIFPGENRENRGHPFSLGMEGIGGIVESRESWTPIFPGKESWESWVWGEEES